MKKLLKWTSIAAAVAAIVCVAAFITLKMIFPAEKVKSLVQTYAQKTLQREVTFSDISFNFIGVTLNKVAISESKTFEQGTFIEADQAILKIALKPLLRKEIDIRTIGLKGLKINIIKNQDGSFNFDDLLAPSTQDEQPKQTDSSDEEISLPFAIAAQDFFIKNASIFYKDLQANQSLTLSNIYLNIEDFDLAKRFTARLQLQLEYQNNMQHIQLPIKSLFVIHLANLNLAQAYVTLQDLTTQYNGMKASFKGGVKNFEQPIVNIQGTVSGISDTSLSSLIADLPHFALPDLRFEADANIDLNASEAALTKAQITLGNSTLTASGKASWAEPAPTYDIQSKINLHLSQIAGMSQWLEGYGMGGNLLGQLTATDKNNGQDIRGNLQLDQITVQYPPVVISELNGNITLASLQNISSSDITGKLNGESFTTTFTYKDLGNILDLVLNLNLSKLKLSTFSTDNNTPEETAAEAASQQATGTGPETLFNVTADVTIGEIEVPYFLSQGATLNVDLKQASASLQHTDGMVSFTLKEGAITDVMSTIKDNKIVKIILLPFSLVNTVTSKLGIALFPKNEQAGQIKFSSGSGTYVFTKGLMKVQETHFNSAISDMTATGQIDFKTETIDMNVKASVLTSQTPIVIKIGGTVSDPSGKLDITKTAVSLVGGILNYKTPGKVASSTVNTATHATKAVVNTGTKKVEASVNTAVNAVKSIGGLFKKNKDTEEKK